MNKIFRLRSCNVYALCVKTNNKLEPTMAIPGKGMRKFREKLSGFLTLFKPNIFEILK